MQPAPAAFPSQPPPEAPAKSEYERLTAFFDQVLRYSLLAIGTILAIAGAFLWKSTSDVQSQAAASIKATQDSANGEISAIGKKAQDAAQTATEKAVQDAIAKSHLEQLIQNTARQTVEETVGAATQR